MSNLFISQFNVKSSAAELYWLVGLIQHEDGACSVRVVLKNVEDHQFHLCTVPIGLLPILTLGQVYSAGKLLTLSAKGLITSDEIADLSIFDEVTSSDIPEELYSFHGRQSGTQRLLHYKTQDTEIFIPTIELIRYLFLHNRTLANALMRPSALMMLYRPYLPGYQKELQLEFTKEMPGKSLSNNFVQEFAWLAFDVEARKSWDSVNLKSKGKEYLTFSPPAIKNSFLRFRGQKFGNQWIVLEILSLGGRLLPCEKLVYSHPSLKKAIAVKGNDLYQCELDCTKSESSKSLIRYEYEYKLEEGLEGARSNSKQNGIESVVKESRFEKAIVIEKQFTEIEKTTAGLGLVQERNVLKEKKIIPVSASELGISADLLPIEFKVLTQAPWSCLGDLDGSAMVINRLVNYMSDTTIAMSLCYLKGGRAFSMANKLPRVAMVVVIESDKMPPLVLIDVERTGGIAVSVQLLRFRKKLSFENMEMCVSSLLDGLVYCVGHWDRSVEEKFADLCEFERLPKMFTPRSTIKCDTQADICVIKLLNKINR